MPPLGSPLAHPNFNLNTAGVAGFFGGEEAISAMDTVHLYKGRRWLGWFNSPGSYTIAKCFGKMANNRFWDGLFPGSNDSPAVSCGLDGEKGPRYVAALSGTTMNTGHLAYLTMEHTRDSEEEVQMIGERVTKSYDVAYLAMKHVDYATPVELLPFKEALLGLIPIIVSVATCVICALVYDWVSFSMILFGIISSGLASVAIGKGKLDIKSVKEPATGSPPGHGILMGEDEVIVIKGEERDVNAITKGSFILDTVSERDHREKKQTGKKKGSVRKHHDIGICSLVLLVQFLAQLLLVPQGTLLGQILFLISLGVSWGYNSYLSSLEKEKIQARVLFQKLGSPVMQRFRTGTRTTMAVFVCLLLFHGVSSSSKEEDRDRRNKILDECVPKDTLVWKRWRAKVVEQLLNSEDTSLTCLAQNADPALSEAGNKLLEQLLEDARAAFKGYFGVHNDLHLDSSQKKVE